jgi:hypothetical protein
MLFKVKERYINVNDRNQAAGAGVILKIIAMDTRISSVYPWQLLILIMRLLYHIFLPN